MTNAFRQRSPTRCVGTDIKLHNHPEIIPQLMERLLAFRDRHRDQEFYHGKLFLTEVHRVRIRQ